MKKFLASIFGIAAALLVFVGCPTSPESTASLTLDKNSLVITSALGGYTNQTLTATLENSTASLEWYTTNSKIVSVSAKGNSATLICEGTQGTARVGVITSDGELEAYCTVSVVLSETPAQALTDVTLAEGSQTVSGFTLNWNYPAISSAAVIDIFETQDAQEAANKLAASSSSQEPTVYKTYSVKRDVLSSSTSGTFTISDLLSNAEGKTYYYSAYGYLNGKRSTSYTNGTAKLIADSTAPGNVENIEASVTDHAITLTWTEPSDEDYESVTVSISPATDFAGNSLSSDVASQTLRKGTTTATFSNLAAETEHTFTFKTADSNGNTQGDANNAQNAGGTATFTTAKDETPPASVSGLSASGGRTSVTLTWSDPSDVDLKEIHVYQDDSTTYTTVAKGTQKLQVSSLNELTQYTFTVKAADYNGNESTASTTTVSTANPVTTNVSATSDINFETIKAKVTLSWNAPTAVEYNNSNELITYKYEIEIKKSEESSLDSKTTDTGATSLTMDLDFDTEYTFTVKTIPSDDETQRFVGDSSSYTLKTVRNLISIKNGWGGRVLVPFKTSSVDYVNCVIVQDDTTKTYNPSVMTYPYWIVREALDGTNGSFSLEAANSDGTASGLYLWFADTAPSGSTKYDVDGTGWGSGSSPHAFTATKDVITADTGAYTSFKFATSSYTGETVSSYSAWTYFMSNTQYWYADNSNPYLVSSIKSGKTMEHSWCYKVIN